MTRITFYVGLGNATPESLLGVKMWLAQRYPGWTWTESTGSWLNPDAGQVETEPSVVITVLDAGGIGSVNEKYANTTAEGIAAVAHQSEVWFTMEPVTVHVAKGL
jgi:hypothetical protein